MKRVLFSLCCLGLLAGRIAAQEQLGLRLDNHAGVNGLLFNPASTATFPHSWDINLLEGAQFFANNYAYLRNAGIPDLFKIKSEEDILLAPDISETDPVPPGAVVIDYDNDGRQRYLTAMTAFLGPSFYVRLGERHQIGLLTRARVIGSAYRVDNDYSYYTYYNRPFFDTFQVAPFRANLLSVGELGLNYALHLPTSTGSISFGATLKVLAGYEGAYAVNQRRFSFTKLPGDTISGAPIDFEYGYTNSNLKDELPRPTVNGKSLGLDLGVVYTIGDEPSHYRWKFAAALTDIGSVRFRTNASRHAVNTEKQVTVASVDYSNLRSSTSVDQKIRAFSQNALGDSIASRIDDQFTIGLPTTFNLQADLNINDFVFLNAAFMQGLPLNGRSGYKGSFVALTPRLEHRWFGLSLPVSMYNGQDFRVGAAVRLAFIQVGTDDLGSFMGQSRLNSTDVYFALKLSPLLIPKFESGGGGGSSGSRKEKIKTVSIGKISGKAGSSKSSKVNKNPISKGKAKGPKEPGCYKF